MKLQELQERFPEIIWKESKEPITLMVVEIDKRSSTVKRRTLDSYQFSSVEHILSLINPQHPIKSITILTDDNSDIVIRTIDEKNFTVRMYIEFANILDNFNHDLFDLLSLEYSTMSKSEVLYAVSRFFDNKK